MAKKSDNHKTKKTDDETPGKKSSQARYQKPPKVPGPRPDYTPKHDHEAERRRQMLAQEITAERQRFPQFCDGIEGTYLIGRNFDNGSESLEVMVKMTNGKTDEFRAIERADGIYLPHVWLFIPLEKCHFALGHIGNEQHQMLKFLQDVLRGDIKEAKQRYWEAQQSQETSTPANVPCITSSIAKDSVTTADIIPIQDKMLEQACRPITDLVKSDCLGIYSAPDEKGALILELRTGKSGNEFVVKKITPEHHLSAHLIYGSIIKVDSAAKTDPEFDQHIRALLEISGIRLSAVKSRRDKRAGVTEGLPNVKEETLLAA